MTQPKQAVLRLSVPKKNERGPMAFEQILASLHGLLTKESKKSGQESISFEIVCTNGRIYFYVVAPAHLRTLISSQFYAQYKEVEIEEVTDYFTKKLIENKKILATSLDPYNAWVFPFKRYPQFEDSTTKEFQDPLGAITSALSHLPNKGDTAVVQFVINPVGSRWEEAAENALKHLTRGGVWQWNWFQDFYQWARLDRRRWVRIARAPIWRLLHFFFAWKASGGGATGKNEDDDSMEVDERTSSGRHDRETIYSAAFDKISRLVFGADIRALYIHADEDTLHAEAKLREIVGAFHQFDIPQMNRFLVGDFEHKENSPLFHDIVHRTANTSFILSQEELATMFHLPTLSVTTPRIVWVENVKLEPPADLPDDSEKEVTLIGKTNFRGHGVKYGIRPDDRRRHVYIIGKTGMGKSTLLENMIFSDIQAGKGVAVIDPHGDLAEAVIRFVPKSRTNDVILFDPSDKDFPIAFNVLEGKNPEQRGLIASGLIGVIKKLNIDSWGPRLEHFLRNTVLALVEAPDTTMLGITRMLVDKVYRAKILHYVQDPMVRSFWETEFNALAPQKLAEAVGPIQNKVGQFLSTPIIRNIVGQPKSTLDLRFAMDTGKIVIVNLSKGKIGEDNSAMLGSLLVTKFQLDAMSRADIPEKDRRDFYLYVDEFQNFATDSFATILSEARKYRLNLTMANQYVAQMSEEVQAAVFGNVGSLISFQIGIDDAKVFSEQFDEEVILPIDLASLPKYEVYNRIMIEGMTSPVFSGATLPPPKIIDTEDPEVRKEKVVKFSRQRYAKPREEVESKIIRWSRPEEEKRKTQKESSPAKASSEKKEEKTKPSTKKEEKK